jgi:GNAT superfamily N-acetyltransferase
VLKLKIRRRADVKTRTGIEESTIEIGRVTEHDYDDTVKLMLKLCEMIGTKFDKDRWHKTFQKQFSEPEKYAGFIAKKENMPVGMVFVEMRGKSGLITNVYVIPEERHTTPVGPMRIPKIDEYTSEHLGELLLNSAFEFIREKGGQEALINLRRGVKPAEKLYQRIGFKESYTVLSKKI